MERLIRLGRELGGVRFAQGPGGNVSIKEGGRLRVKASGKRLRELHLPDAISDVPLELAANALAGDPAADKELFASRPRPSLEAYFHALGAATVAHTHAVGAVIAACANAPVPLPPGTLTVDYVSPGRGLALGVEKALGDRRVASVLLKSHGLIVYADTVEDAVRETIAFDEFCRRPFPAVRDLEGALSALPAIRTLSDGAGAYVELSRRESSGRYLCPDAVVFASAFRVDELSDPDAQVRNALATWGRPVILHATKDGRRILAGRSADELQQACEVALAHDVIEDALLGAGGGRYLPDDEPAKILNLPSEKYRLQLTGDKGASC